MLEDNVREELRHRANIYKILSGLYYQPTEELEVLLTHLKDALEALCPELVPNAVKMAEDFCRYAEDLTDLKVDHARLFIGPDQLLAPPYSSVYLDPGRQVMGESTMVAYAHYRDAGLDMELDYNEPPDHIAAELEFMYYLIVKYLNTEDMSFVEKQRSFLSSHLGLWIKQFTDNVKALAATEFYKNLGLITQRFVNNELKLPKV